MKQTKSTTNRVVTVTLQTKILFLMGIMIIPSSNVCRLVFSRSGCGPSLVAAFHFHFQFQFQLLSSHSRPKLGPRSVFQNNCYHNHRQQGKLYSGSSSTTTTTQPEKSAPLSPRQKLLQRFDNDNNQLSTDSKHLQDAQRNAFIDTLDWLEHVVIGYNLCPFAEAPMLREELTIQVVMGTNQTEILSEVLGESLRLKNRPGTSLVVCPDLCPNNFLAFLEVYNILVEGVIPDQELQDDLQIAPFHPLFVFGDEEEEEDDHNDPNDPNDSDSIGHYTNRSPFPTFHVLREAEVEKAVDVLDGNAETVWKRNVDVLQAMEDLFALPNESSSNQPEPELLRSVFLKGKAREATRSKTCPFAKHSESIQAYHQQIRTLLREFRKKDY